MLDAELEAMLRIDFAAYLAAEGFAHDKAESTQTSLKMRRGAEVLILRRRADGVWEYFNTGDDRDHGTVVQYIQRRTGKNLGHVRVHLRPWLMGGSEPVPLWPGRAGEAAEPDLPGVRRRWDKAQPVKGLPGYLARRGLSADTVFRFAGVMRTDWKGNVLFAHTNDAGELTGYEIKGDGVSFFSKAGLKALARFMPPPVVAVRRLAVVESGIEALSLAQLTGWHDAGYLSAGGAFSPHTVELVQAALAAWPGAELVAAFNADAAGARLTARLREALPQATVMVPDHATGKDWNDMLQARAAAPVQPSLFPDSPPGRIAP